jgi:hydroxymethylpyrimidine/phosphomethylpyrimidine kinase
MKSYFRTLTIAGSDSGGGAGIQADLKTFSALGCYGMSVITALTAQNTVAVTGIFPIPPDFIARQMDAVITDIGVDAVKIGMLHSPEVIETVADNLRQHQVKTIVVDPVMVAKSGDKLLRDDAVQALKETLIPMATLITPNLPEAGVLLGCDIPGQEEMPLACRELAELGCKNVFLKGGHLTGARCVDYLFETASSKLTALDGPRVQTSNSHGTGCTISSAITSYLARGLDVESAVREAKAYIVQALEAGAQVKIGNGHGPVHHFHGVWDAAG